MNAKPGPKKNEKNLVHESKKHFMISQLVMKLVLTLSQLIWGFYLDK